MDHGEERKFVNNLFRESTQEMAGVSTHPNALKGRQSTGTSVTLDVHE